MSQLGTFITANHRPEINGGRLDKNHQPRFTLDYSAIDNTKELAITTIAFGPKKDKVLLNLEHGIKHDDSILILYYEDIHKRWSYVRTNHETYFIFKKNANEQYKIKACSLYIRGCQLDMDDPYWITIGEFYTFVDSWIGRVICAPHKQNNNESKLYQLNSSLKQSKSRKKEISIGRSFVIKGKKSLQKLKFKEHSYIVKSLSGVRSIVVDEQEFIDWNQDNINNLPVLFQEKAKGADLRVHVVNGKLYGKLSLAKDNVDYRYDDNFFSLQDFTDFKENVKNFCIDVTKIEANPLMGIDFIKSEQDKYVVLEANPSPGWSAYHECNGIENDAFMQDLLQELKRGD